MARIATMPPIMPSVSFPEIRMRLGAVGQAPGARLYSRYWLRSELEFQRRGLVCHQIFELLTELVRSGLGHAGVLLNFRGVREVILAQAQHVAPRDLVILGVD